LATPWIFCGLCALFLRLSRRAEHKERAGPPRRECKPSGECYHFRGIPRSPWFGPRNQFFEEYIDEDRLGASDERLEEALREKYSDKKMDLVIGDGRPGFTFLLRRGEELRRIRQHRIAVSNPGHL
jgi:hypothetical protein